jgi:hypothetical protein
MIEIVLGVCVVVAFYAVPIVIVGGFVYVILHFVTKFW